MHYLKYQALNKSTQVSEFTILINLYNMFGENWNSVAFKLNPLRCGRN